MIGRLVPSTAGGVWQSLHGGGLLVASTRLNGNFPVEEKSSSHHKQLFKSPVISTGASSRGVPGTPLQPYPSDTVILVPTKNEASAPFNVDFDIEALILHLMSRSGACIVFVERDAVGVALLCERA